MRNLFNVVFTGLAAVVFASTAAASDVVVKGPHICCGQCVKVAKGILSKVDGVSDADADAKTKTVSFKAKDEAAAKAGVKALFDAGFYGAATNDGKELKVPVSAAAKGGKADKVTVEGVHSCCGLCRKAITALFADSKVSYEGKGPQQTVIIEGGELYRGTVLEALRKAGFNGTVAK